MSEQKLTDSEMDHLLEYDCEKTHSVQYESKRYCQVFALIREVRELRPSLATIAQQAETIRTLRAALVEASPWIDSHQNHDHDQFVFNCEPCQVDITIRSALAATEGQA